MLEENTNVLIRGAAVLAAQLRDFLGVASVDRGNDHAAYRARRTRMRLRDIPAAHQPDLHGHGFMRAFAREIVVGRNCLRASRGTCRGGFTPPSVAEIPA